RQLCAELLELVDLSEKRNDPVEVLSRGMKQRLGLARCLVHDPEVLLLDEPASGMDPRARIELREILRELGRMNKTILISSHILPELAEMCTHVGIIRAGQLLAEGPVDGVIAALSANSKLRIRLLHPARQAEAMRLLEAWASTEGSPLQDIETENDRTLVVAFTGDESDLASLLVEFVRAGVPITSFSREEGTLEDVFLQVSGLGEAD
ncbi:MAG: ABC transporter ATP-binding protein, partial [Chloroflexota bacterium]|nr:ABC transporter ATP-binding protein [Chloroflexota bacterium]